MKLETTKDGSPTLLNENGVAYHSRDGAISEARYIYLGAGKLEERLTNGNVSILEIGLGTGLNFILSAQLAEHFSGSTLNYIAYEVAFPPASILKEFHLAAGLGDDWYADIRPGQGSRKNLNWEFRNRPWPEVIAEKFDLIYYDAFGPKDEPSLWEETVLLHTLSLLAPGGALVTFSISGATRRLLRNGGYAFETPKGFGYKREMLIVNAAPENA